MNKLLSVKSSGIFHKMIFLILGFDKTFLRFHSKQIIYFVLIWYKVLQIGNYLRSLNRILVTQYNKHWEKSLKLYRSVTIDIFLVTCDKKRIPIVHKIWSNSTSMLPTFEKLSSDLTNRILNQFILFVSLPLCCMCI